MNKKILKIGKIYILDESNQMCKLCSDITVQNKKSVLYYEVEQQFKKYLLTDRCDAFLLGLINHAMYEGYDIVCEGKVTEQLVFQLMNYYIPVLSSNFHDLNRINIKAELESAPIKNVGAVGTGNSGGIDSFYTAIKYNNDVLGSYKLTHLIFNNISTQDIDEERIRLQFERDKDEKNLIARKMELVPVNVYSNLYEFYAHPGIFNYYFTAQYASIPYALAGLFSVYYFSSGVSVSDFSMDERKIKDGAYFDLFSLECLSIENLKLYSAGSEVKRLEKTKFIMNDHVCQNHLQVCSVDQCGERVNTRYLNCGKCPKCMRTISSLYALQCLEEYKAIFDLDYFEKHKSRYIGYELGYDSKAFTGEIFELMKFNKLINISIMIWKTFYSFKHYMSTKKKLHNFWRRIVYGEKAGK